MGPVRLLWHETVQMVKPRFGIPLASICVPGTAQRLLSGLHFLAVPSLQSQLPQLAHVNWEECKESILDECKPESRSCRWK
ncbi:Transmembrane Protein 87A [Manis pentadactyla]|nr:Transmembrane Protein 87A [Manis pentadactyla]